MRSLPRRLSLTALAILLVVAVAPIGASAADLTDEELAAVAAAEQRAHSLANVERVERGLVKLRWDKRLAELARERATHMAETDTFSHTQSGGTSVFDMMSAAGIRWYGAGEIIAWNIGTELRDSADYVIRQWMNSSGHKAIMVSKDYNYVGFGVATSPTSGKRYWVGVYMKGPDRTGGWTKVRSLSKRIVDRRTTRVTFRWDGGDIRLQVLTAGLRYFQVQARRAGGTWTTYPTTTRESFSRSWRRGYDYEIRVRARDRKGNWGAWVTKAFSL